MKKTLKEQILELKEKGYSYNQIKEQLGCSKGTIAYHIGIGQKNKTIERNSNRRNKIVRFIQEYKSGKKCADCGEDYPYWILEFDHLQDKNFTIAQFRSTTMSIDIVKEEIDKCDVVCSNCHKNRTFSRSLKTLDGVGFENCEYPE